MLVLLTGCAGNTSGPLQSALYDFGASPVVAAPAKRLPAIVVDEVSGPAWLDMPYIYYRLAYTDAQRLHPYANSRWAMTAPQLLKQRARARLVTVSDALPESEWRNIPVLRLELDEFTQVFDQPGASRGVVQVRATLTRNGRLLAQRGFTQQRAASSPDAQGGVHALTGATDDVLDELAAWLAQQLP